MKTNIMLSIIGLSALAGLAMLDDDSRNIPSIQQNAIGVIVNAGVEFADIDYHAAYDTKNGGQICYRVKQYVGTYNRVLCVELVENEYVLSVDL